MRRIAIPVISLEKALETTCQVCLKRLLSGQRLWSLGAVEHVPGTPRVMVFVIFFFFLSSFFSHLTVLAFLYASKAVNQIKQLCISWKLPLFNQAWCWGIYFADVEAFLRVGLEDRIRQIFVIKKWNCINKKLTHWTKQKKMLTVGLTGLLQLPCRGLVNRKPHFEIPHRLTSGILWDSRDFVSEVCEGYLIQQL